MHYVVTIDVKRVGDPTPDVPARTSAEKADRGTVIDLAHVVVKHADLDELKRLAGAHLELVSDI